MAEPERLDAATAGDGTDHLTDDASARPCVQEAPCARCPHGDEERPRADQAEWIDAVVTTNLRGRRQHGDPLEAHVEARAGRERLITNGISTVSLCSVRRSNGCVPTRWSVSKQTK